MLGVIKPVQFIGTGGVSEDRKERGKSPDNDEVVSTLEKTIESLRTIKRRCSTSRAEHPDDLEKKTVEVHQLQFSYQEVDVQLVESQ